MGKFELLTLLVRCLPIVREQVSGQIECISQLRVVRTDDLEFVAPVPGSIPAEDLPEIEKALALVRDIEAVTGRMYSGPDWFDDMVDLGVGGSSPKGGA